VKIFINLFLLHTLQPAQTNKKGAGTGKLRLRRSDDYMQGARMTRRTANLLGVNPDENAPLPPWGASEKRAAQRQQISSFSSSTEYSSSSSAAAGALPTIGSSEIDQDAFVSDMLVGDDERSNPTLATSTVALSRNGGGMEASFKRPNSQISQGDVDSDEDEAEGEDVEDAIQDEDDVDAQDELPDVADEVDSAYVATGDYGVMEGADNGEPDEGSAAADVFATSDQASLFAAAFFADSNEDAD
jgi:hypothetical protein